VSYISDHARHNDLARALQICRLIAHEAHTLQELADRLQVHQRTIRRAIYMLQGAGLDIMTATSSTDEGDDLGQPFSRELEAAKLYKLDVRAWTGMLFLPADVRTADGGAR